MTIELYPGPSTSSDDKNSSLFRYIKALYTGQYKIPSPKDIQPETTSSSSFELLCTGNFAPYYLQCNSAPFRLIDGHPILIDVYIAVLRVKKKSQFINAWTRIWQSPLPATMDTMGSFVLCYREIGISRFPSSPAERESRINSRYWSLFPGQLSPFGPGSYEALNTRDVLGYLRIAEDVENRELPILTKIYYDYYGAPFMMEPMFPEGHIFNALEHFRRSNFLAINQGSWCRKAFFIQFKQFIVEWIKKASEKVYCSPRQLDFPLIYFHDRTSRCAEGRSLSAYRNEEIWSVKDLIQIELEAENLSVKYPMQIEQEMEE